MPHTDAPRSWRRAFVGGAKRAQELAAHVDADEPQLEAIALAERAFPFRATDYYLGLADLGDPDDPILRQVLPDAREVGAQPGGFCADAVGDLVPEHHPASGLVHKYQGRALLVTTGACPVHCRFCFRRSYPYEELADAGPHLRRALDGIRDDTTISEVILSGGDPLSLSDDVLRSLFSQLEQIPHLRRLRLHTRYPVVLPERITGGLVNILSSCKLPLWLVTHFNHPRELTSAARAACELLQAGGIPMLNQSVLLRGVNDRAEVLQELFEGLLDWGVKPYYLHQLDRVSGTAHFEVEPERGQALFERLRARISGIGLPAYVRDLPGQASKTPLSALLVLLACTSLLLGGCRESNEGDQVSGPPVAQEGAPPEVAESVARATPPPVPMPQAPQAVSPARIGPTDTGRVSADMGLLAAADRLLVADFAGDGRPELLVNSGGEIRWGEWPEAAVAPQLTGRYQGKGQLQAWFAADLDGDGQQEVVAAFGKGRGFLDAPLEVVLIEQVGAQTVSFLLWKTHGPRNQATALYPWPRGDGTFDLYLSAFESRFVVRGGLLSRDGGEVKWLDGHRLRMGMARAVADFDGDGRMEVAVGRLYGDAKGEDGDLRVLQEDGRIESVPTVRGVRAVAAADIDGDGRSELLFGDGWHINYGKLARYRPSVARRDVSGQWRVELLTESSEQYAVEKIGFAEGVVIAGGNAQVAVYAETDGAWTPVGASWPSSLAGAWTVLPGRGVVVGGKVPRGPYPIRTRGP